MKIIIKKLLDLLFINNISTNFFLYINLSFIKKSFLLDLLQY